MKEVLLVLCSGLLASLVTILLQRSHDIKQEKVKVFITLMSKRYDIASQESVEALNVVDVLFHKSKKVREALQAFLTATEMAETPNRGQVINDKHLRLLEEIAKDIGYADINWEDIKHFYNPTGLSIRLQEEAILRRVQIDAGLAQLRSSKKVTDTTQIDPNSELASRLLLEAMRNPDGMVKLIEATEKIKPKK